MITLRSIGFENEGKKLMYDYTVDSAFSKYFNPNEPLYVEYESDMRSVPASILVIPFLSNVLPMAWFLGIDVNVPEVDAEFAESVEQVRGQMQQSHKTVQLGKGKLNAREIIENKGTGERSATLFSGGIDAYTTYLRHASEHPDLITIFGADVDLSNTEVWDRVVALNEREPILSENPKRYIKSNMRRFYTYKVETLYDLSWWGQVQHGLGLNGLVAPLAYLHGYRIIYIASTYTGNIDIAWGSTPDLDDKIRFCGAGVKHDAYEMLRTEKTRFIVETMTAKGKHLNLRVCFSELNTGTNCSKCEKCLRSIIAIILCNADPNHFGFKTDASVYDTIKRTFANGFATKGVRYFWWEITEMMKQGEPFFVFSDQQRETQQMQELTAFLEATADKKFKRSSLSGLKFHLRGMFPNAFKAYLKFRQRNLKA